MFSGKAAGAAAPAAEGSGSDLLIRFFESPWFDAYIALTYLYKSKSPGVQDYLCNRLYTLPERDVERYLSQLAQLCIQRPGSSLERVITDLCAQSLRIAVKAYWLLLAISQDNPRDAHVAALRDACEQAALQGYWQLPFKQSRLPAPLSVSPTKRRFGAGSASGSAQHSPLISPANSFTHMQRSGWALSPEPRRPGHSDSQRPLSPGDNDSRPMSPDGLGGGLYSSVFMDTGVEGLIYSAPQVDDQLREHRQHVSSPRVGHGRLLEGPGRPLLPVQMDSQRSSNLQKELGAGEGVSALVLRSSTAGEGGGPGSMQQSEEGSDLAAGAGLSRSFVANGGGSFPAGAAALFSPPNSPRRRQTTFGATLDFVETLCQASTSLTAFQPEDRQWALRRALQQINAEIEKASRNGVAIWFPMGEADLRVVRLAPRESRLLNSREKAPFTLCVEVLDEAEAAAAVQARAAAEMAAAADAAGKDKGAAIGSGGSSGQYADSAKSVLMMDQPPVVEDEAAAAAAAEAAASGIPFYANHHRTLSMDTISTSDGSLEAAALAAVQGSSAVTGDALGAAAHSPRPASSESTTPRSPHGSVRSGDPLTAEPSFAGMLAGSGSPAQGSRGGAKGGAAVSPARPRRLTDDLDAVSDVPSFSEGSSSMLGSPTGVDGEGDALLSTPGGSVSVRFESQASPRQQQHAQPPLQQDQQQQEEKQPAALALPSLVAGKHPGSGTWIGGGGSPRATDIPVEKAAAGGAGRGSGKPPQSPSLSSGLETALAGLRGEAPLVAVRFEVLNDTPLNSARSSIGGDGGTESLWQAAKGSSGGMPGSALSIAERRRGSLDSSTGGSPHQCDRSSWACKLGLCKLCNAKLATMEEDGSDPRLQPHVRVHFTVQGGVDLSIRKTPGKHQRMPSHEAILKVAKQHKLPAPELPLPNPLAPPAQQNLAASQQHTMRATQPSQQQQQVQASAVTAACLPVWRPAGSSSNSPRHSSEQPAVLSEEAQRRQAAEAAYGEPWAARKKRVQAASPHGRRPGWDLRCVIVKTGDDCRQELLAMQLIRAFHEIFAEAQLPLWLRPYEVLPTSNRTALIEMVPNAPSIHAIKSKHAPGTSLRDHLAARFGGEGSPAFQRAQRCFVESMAAYSLVSYLLQIKDRHNGNILLDDEGHIIHIDFGFMLSNSPGGVNFESAPFKLTRELLEVMDSNSEGRASEIFDYFKVLVIQGFLALRKHADRILLLVEMMQGSGCPCFKSRVGAVQGLRKRFHLTLPEPQLVEVALGLISDSLDAWRTRQYDYYQRVLNGIL